MTLTRLGAPPRTLRSRSDEPDSVQRPERPAGEQADALLRFPAQPNERRCRILAVADQPALLRLLGLTLRDTFGSVHLAASAEAAFVRLDEADFDIAVLDLRPGGEYTGWELARAVHTRRPNLALVVTAWVDEAAPTNPAQAGVTAVLFKPYSGSELRRVITELCQRQAPA